MRTLSGFVIARAPSLLPPEPRDPVAHRWKREQEQQQRREHGFAARPIHHQRAYDHTSRHAARDRYEVAAWLTRPLSEQDEPQQRQEQPRQPECAREGERPEAPRVAPDHVLAGERRDQDEDAHRQRRGRERDRQVRPARGRVQATVARGGAVPGGWWQWAASASHGRHLEGQLEGHVGVAQGNHSADSGEEAEGGLVAVREPSPDAPEAAITRERQQLLRQLRCDASAPVVG